MKANPQINRGTSHRRAAFTLLELLVVVAIIAVLAGIAFPVGNAVAAHAKRTAVAAHAKQIVLGLRMYATDEGDRFPSDQNGFGESIETSNDAFRDIIEYVDRDERIFAVAGSAWGHSADLKTDSSAQVLEPGENHFAYISGLSTNVRGFWPLVVDGTDGAGQYTTTAGERGGLWKGQYAVVGRVDGSASAIRLKGAGDERYLPKHDDDSADGLNVGRYMGSRARLLDPAG